MINKQTLKGIILVNIATFTWATNIVLGRYVRGSIGPLTLTASRYIVASVIFAFLLKKLPAGERRIKGDFLLLTAMSATGVVMFAPVLYLAMRYTTAVNGTLINSLAPLVTAVFAAWILKEKITRWQMAGAVMALTGVVFLISGGSAAFWEKTDINPGDFIVIIAVIIWALYSVVSSKVMRNRSSLSATALSIFMGLPVLAAAAAVEIMFISPSVDFKIICIILYIGVFPAALGFSCWNAGVARLGASGAMVFYNSMPLYGTLLGFAFLGEPVGLPHIIGGALIIGGGITAALNRS